MKHLISLSLVIFFLASCSSPKKKAEEQESQSEDSPSGITLTKAPDSPQFPDAKLTKLGVDKNAATDSTETVDYNFDVEGYELGIQTSDAATRGLANSKKGQHIHFIVNNGPYKAHYMPGISSDLPHGDYVVLSFLSRSYHESVKSKNAYHIEKLSVGSPIEPSMEVDLEAPHLFYSRPKGKYSGEDAKKLMLDFYLVNADLSANGNSVRATINEEEFLIDEWAPYYIEGLPMGEVKIKLEFLDANGELVDSPFNPVKRKVTLSD